MMMILAAGQLANMFRDIGQHDWVDLPPESPIKKDGFV